MSAYIDKFRELKPAFKDSTDEELIPYLHEKYASDMPISEFYKKIGVEDPNAPGDISRGFSTGMEQLKQTGYGILAAGGATTEHALGEGGISTGIKKAGLAGYKEQEEKIAETAKPSDEAIYSWEKAKEGDFGALADWMQYGIGQAGSQAVQALATAGLGGFVAKQGIKYAGKELAEKLVQSQAAKIAETEATKIAAGELTKEAIEQQATKMVAEKIGNIGATTALGGLAVTQEGGEIGGDLIAKAEKEGKPLTGDQLAKAFGYSLGAGALEFVGDKFGLDVLTGKTKFGKTIGGMEDLGGRVARGTVAGLTAAPVEAGTEYGQTLLEEAGKGNDPFSEQARKNAINAAAAGAFGGHVMGMAGGILTAPIAKATTVDDAIINAEKALSEPTVPAPIVPPAPAAPTNEIANNILNKPSLVVKTGFGALSEFENFANQEAKEKAEQLDKLVAKQRLEKESALETLNNTIGTEQQKATAKERLLMLNNVLDDTSISNENKKAKFEADLKRAGYTNKNLTDFETQHLDRYLGFLTQEEEAKANIIPSLPNEWNPYKEQKPIVVSPVKSGGIFGQTHQLQINKIEPDDRVVNIGGNDIDFRKFAIGQITSGAKPYEVAKENFNKIYNEQNQAKSPVTTEQPVKPIAETKTPTVQPKPVEFTPTHEFNDGTPVVKAKELETKTKIQPVAQEQAPVKKLFNVNGVQIDYDQLTPEQKTAWDEADVEHALSIKYAGQFNAQDRGKQIKASGMRLSAKRREIVNALTAKEQEAQSKKESVIRNGDIVSHAEFGNGVVKSNPAYGKAKVQFGDNEKSVNLNELVKQTKIEPTIQQPRKGTVGGKLAAGEVVITSSGRQTTPFPKFQTKEGNVKPVHLKAVDKWLMKNAFEEAKARGDEFNARQFEANLDKPSQADKDSAEEYLFGEQPVVKKPILKPLVKDQSKLEIKPAILATSKNSEEITKAQQDVLDALSAIGEAVGQNFRMNITPEQEQKLMPALTRLMDAAFRLGYYKFKDAAKFTLETIRKAFGDELADQINLQHLQGSYIGMSGKYIGQGADSFAQVGEFKSIEQIFKIEGDKSAVEKQETTQPNGSRGAQSRVRKKGEDTTEGRAGIREGGQEERDISQDLIDVFNKLGKQGISKSGESLIKQRSNADIITAVQNHWLDVLADIGYEKESKSDNPNGKVFIQC